MGGSSGWSDGVAAALGSSLACFYFRAPVAFFLSFPLLLLLLMAA
jgi:hypothetical protein